MHTTTAPVAAKPRTRFAYLYVTVDGRTRCIASNHYGEFGLNHTNQWAWVTGYMIQEFGCNPEDVTCVETDDGDRIAVSGKIVGQIEDE